MMLTGSVVLTNLSSQLAVEAIDPDLIQRHDSGALYLSALSLSLNSLSHSLPLNFECTFYRVRPAPP